MSNIHINWLSDFSVTFRIYKKLLGYLASGTVKKKQVPRVSVVISAHMYCNFVYKCKNRYYFGEEKKLSLIVFFALF